MSLVRLAFAATALCLPLNAYAADIASNNLTSTTSDSIWTGFYGGVTAGYSMGSGEVTNTSVDVTQSVDDVSGFIGGIQAGYDFQIGSVILGAAADYAFTNAEGSRTVLFLETPTTGTIEIDSTATFRARLGYVFSDAIMGYLTGGVAMSDYTVSVETSVFSDSEDQTATGYVVGAGAEYRLTENITSFGEYRYYSYNSIEFDDLGAEADFDQNEVRVGINYRF